MIRYLSFLALVAVFIPSAIVLADGHNPSEHASTSTLESIEEREEPVLYFFYSPTCPHCHKQHAWLDAIEPTYPELDVQRYEVNQENQQLMVDLILEHNAQQSAGLVPLTFVNGDYFVGFDGNETTGVAIEAAIRAVLGLPAMDVDASTEVREGGINVPLAGTVYPEDYSLSMLAVVLGFLDGFNVCSLGALILIIGLALKLQRRRAIALFGGIFILTTSLVYGALIVVWYNIFDLFTSYINIMKLGVALISIGGGLYFLKEYLRMRKQGAVCEMQESPLVQRLMKRTGDAFQDGSKLLSILGVVFVFAAVVTIVEFPCSAAVPVVFAGILADAGLSTLSHLSHIGLFVLFYMLDELVVFGIAVYKLRLWMMSGTFTKWAVLVEALVLLGIGLWYLWAILGL